METISDLGRAVLEGGRLDREGLMSAVAHSEDRPWELLRWADEVRRRRFGNNVRLCSIVPGKLGGCSEDCKWCAQSASCGPMRQPPKHAGIGEILSAASAAVANGASSLGIVNSGRRPSRRELQDVLDAVQAVRDAHPSDLNVCCSLGEINPRQADLLARAGVRRYHHNLETSRRFFPNVVTTHGYEDRLATLRAARQAGVSICCGGLFGIGETWQDRVDLALTLRDQVAPEVAPLNFLHPIPGTPLENADMLKPLDALRIIAIFRLALPAVDIKVAGGRCVVLRDLQSWIFHAGATSCMVGNYLTTAGRDVETDIRMIEDLGLKIVAEHNPACVKDHTSAPAPIARIGGE